jgi:hypothetical protein
MELEFIALATEREAPGAGGESRTPTGVSPPGSEPGTSSISVTPAWWTQPDSNLHASRCKRGALPLGPGSRWVESNDRRHNAARVTAALLSPTEVTGAGSVGVAAPIDAVPIPNLAYYLVVNVR